MYILSPLSVILGILIYVFYKIRLGGKKELKEKYDFVSKYEMKFLFAAHIAIAIGIFLLCNTYKELTVLKSLLWFWIRLFISICIGVLYGYIAQLMLKFYYPGIQAKKLKKYRYTTRINPKNGNPMKLLSEEEEDAYLDEGMQAEENVFSVDYDVWIDLETGDTHIEKYEGRLHALECDRCGFQTLKLEKEEVTKEASEYEEGELIKHYKCTYCKRIKRNTVKLSKHKTESDFKVTETTKFVENPLHDGPQVIAVKIEIHGSDGSAKSYEFQNLNESSKFLKEFDYGKIE
ncbi:MAG: hypothetical protein JXR07_15965 [Reichenbachiella sp.]